MASDERGAGDPKPRSNCDSWAAVLSAVEADVRRTEELLATSAEAARPVGAPAEAMLPNPHRQHAEVTWAALPALEDMPPVPAELTARIRIMRAQIVALQAEIKTEMARWRASCATRRPASPPASAGESFYMDRFV
jgi:hypothetical protein